jgi:hypothetical protein
VIVLRQGQIVRFKGPHAAERAQEFADELHGRCKREGNQLQITQSTGLRPDLAPRDETPRLERDEIIEFDRTGHKSATATLRR